MHNFVFSPHLINIIRRADFLCVQTFDDGPCAAFVTIVQRK